jgi:hypothetical protein
MLPMQRKFGPVVIKSARGKDRFPTRGRMACLAGALEGCILKSAAMRIGVTILAIGKRQALIMHGGFARLGPVTLHTSYILMKSGEREGRAEMVKTLRWLPGFLIVAAQAFSA